MNIKNNILETIGNTPIVRLNQIGKELKTPLLAKVEFFNPGGSIKDRVADYIIKVAEERGQLKKGGTIIEATSGNTGMGLALAAAVRGYKTIFVLPDKMSDEKIQALRAFGARVVVTPTAVAPEDPRSYYSVARKLVEVTPNSFYANQYHNPDNPEIHYQTTGLEIWEQTDGKVGAVVAGVGTGGTISGISRRVKEKNPKVVVVGVDPKGSILKEYKDTGKMTTQPKTYKMEGIGEDFLPDNVQFNRIDEFITIDDKEAMLMTRDLLHKEGIYAGMSSGAAICGALKFAKANPNIENIVVVLPDSGNRYLSKVYNDTWMREYGFLESPLTDTVGALLNTMAYSEVLTAKHTDTIQEVIGKMKERSISQMPVYADGQITGVIDESDIIMPLLTGLAKSNDRIVNFVKPSVITVNFDDKLQKVSEMLSKGFVALCTDKQNRLRIITKIDFIDYLGKRIS